LRNSLSLHPNNTHFHLEHEQPRRISFFGWFLGLRGLIMLLCWRMSEEEELDRNGQCGVEHHDKNQQEFAPLFVSGVENRVEVA
jgi:hypothetical protein